MVFLGWGSRRSAERLYVRSMAAVTCGRWRRALRLNERAEAALNRAIGETGPFPGDERTLASLYYNRAGIQEKLGDLLAARAAAERGWQLYDRLDPVRARPSEIAAVLERTQVSAPAGERRARAGRAVEEAIAQAADAWIRCVRLEAVVDGDLFELEYTRKRGSWALDVYRELVRVGHHYGPADMARVQAEFTAALEARRRRT